MPYFTPDELNLICIYDPGNLSGLIYELAAMMHVLMPDEKELYKLAHGTIEKLSTMNIESYAALSKQLTPEFDEFPFDEIPELDDLDEMEE